MRDAQIPGYRLRIAVTAGRASKPRIQLLDWAVIPAAAQTLADAFMADPLFAWFIGHDARRRRWLVTFMNAAVRLVASKGHCYAVAREGVPGVLSLLAPGQYPPSRWRGLAFTLRLLPRVLIGQPRLSRVRQGLSLLNELEAVHCEEPHWYVYQVAVSPEAQGQGLGRLLMDRVCKLADQDDAPAYLETANPDNLGFYERFGFAVEDTLRGPGDMPPLWTMRRPAPSASISTDGRERR